MKIVLIILISLLISSCGYKSEWDFKNYLRDKYPYSCIEEFESNSGYGYSYIVYDTINNNIYSETLSSNLETNRSFKLNNSLINKCKK